MEPVHYAKSKLLFAELDDVNEVIFVEHGFYDIGYEINKQKKYCIKYTDKCVIGAFGVTFN